MTNEQVKKLSKIAELMHGELCNCDDKYCTLENEIFNWLYNGDAENLTEADVPDLIGEWREYDGQL